MRNTEPSGEGGALTVESLREVVIALAAELRVAGRDESAQQLHNAADLRSSAADEVLVMREALVRTRPEWDSPRLASSRRAAAAMNEAKALSIRL